MPIKIPNNLPAREILEKERVLIISEKRAARQRIRPLEIAILNLMPDKIRTETQLLRVLGTTPLQINVTFLRTGTYTSTNTSDNHLSSFYQTWDEVKHRKFDALIVTGAPVEQLPFEEVLYWQELQEVLNWAESHVYSSFFVCWGAQAALHHYHDIPKYDVDKKLFGVFSQNNLSPYHPLTTGFDDTFNVPVSRHTEIRAHDVEKIKELEILAESEQTGICLINDQNNRRVYMFNHLEYDSDTLKNEYDRDVKAGSQTALPHNYYPDNNPQNMPYIKWRAHRNLLFSNWINIVYQGTAYNLDDLGTFGIDNHDI